MSRSEAAVSADALLRYDALGWRLWRNNSGVLLDKRGVPVRFGLGNTSPEINTRLKSPDYVGWRPLLITPDMVGGVVAQAAGIEFKAEDWRPALSGERYEHERAQQRWGDLLRADGGFWEFCNGSLP